MERWRRRRAMARVRPGNGSVLTPLRWWHVAGRSRMHLRIDGAGAAAAPTRYAVDVRHGGDAHTATARAELFRNGRQCAVGTLPVTFPVEGGVIEVVTSTVGLRRCDYVTSAGHRRPLQPDPRSAEGRRARFEARHPRANRWLGVVSAVTLLVGVAALLMTLVTSLAAVPALAEHLDGVALAWTPPAWATTVLAFATPLAGVERALRLRYRWWLDGLAG